LFHNFPDRWAFGAGNHDGVSLSPHLKVLTRRICTATTLVSTANSCGRKLFHNL